MLPLAMLLELLQSLLTIRKSADVQGAGRVQREAAYA